MKRKAAIHCRDEKNRATEEEAKRVGEDASRDPALDRETQPFLMEDLFEAWRRFVDLGEVLQGVRPMVREAWSRCATCGLNPRQLEVQEPDLVRLQQARERNQALLEAVEPGPQQKGKEGGCWTQQ